VPLTLVLLAVPLLGVALGANVLGWVQLSSLLAGATVSSAYSGFAWLIVVTATAALLPAVINGPLGDLLPSLRRNETAVRRVATRAVGVVAVIVWLRGALNNFQLDVKLSDAVESFAGSAISIGGLTIVMGGLIGAGFMLLLAWLLARLVRFFLKEEVVPRLRLRRGSGQSLITLTNYVVWGVGIALAASAAGLSGTQLSVVIGALSVGIGFGLQTIVNNFVSGLILIFEQPIKVGDTVQTPDLWGRVERIGIRASVIRSFEGAEIVVPNGDLVSKTVTNWTRTDEIRRTEVLVGVAYGTDPAKVLEILGRVAEEHPKVLKSPEIKAHMIRFGDSSLDFRLRAWAPMDDWIDVMSDLNVAINRELNAAGITIPFPQRDLHIKTPGIEKDVVPCRQEE